MKMAYRHILKLLISLALVACAPVQPLPTPVPPDAPRPDEIRIIDGDNEEVLQPGEPRFAEAESQLIYLIASINAQARTLFTPERFEQEISRSQYLHIIYAETVEFRGKGITWRAAELVVAAPGGEPMLLTRATQAEDWSVYLPDDPAAFQELMNEFFTNPFSP
jgi:hypothetical protein